MRNKYNVFSWILTAAIIISLASVLLDMGKKPTESTYSALVGHIQRGEISELYVDDTTALAKLEEEEITCEIPSKEILSADVGEEILRQASEGTLVYKLAPKHTSWLSYILPISSVLMLIL